MPTTIKQFADIKDDDQATTSEALKGMHLISQTIQRRQARAGEIKLKGFFVDYLFDRLNLTKYR